MATPVAVLVTVAINPERKEEFLEIIKYDAVASCTEENGGCLQFDVLAHADDPNKFTFYEVYKDDEAIAFHRTTPHFEKWNVFQASGGVLSVAVQKFSVPITATVTK